MATEGYLNKECCGRGKTDICFGSVLALSCWSFCHGCHTRGHAGRDMIYLSCSFMRPKQPTICAELLPFSIEANWIQKVKEIQPVSLSLKSANPVPLTQRWYNIVSQRLTKPLQPQKEMQHLLFLENVYSWEPWCVSSPFFSTVNLWGRTAVTHNV